jgi:hypothetical protein
MNWKSFATGSVCVVLSITTGCSLFVPARQMINIESSEPQAKVWINGLYQGETPVQSRVLRNHNILLLVKKEGFETQKKFVECHFNTTGVLDIVGTCCFLLPLLGVVSPGAYSLDETDFQVHLVAERSPAALTNAPAATSP